MSSRLLMYGAILNALVFPAAAVAFFAGSLHEYAWVGAVILNALVFLSFYRHAHRNEQLTRAQRDRWEIVLFFFSPVASLVYLWRHVREAEPERAA